MVALSVGALPAAATTPSSIDTSYGTGGVTVVPGSVVGATTVDSAGRALVLGPVNGDGTGGQVTRLTTTGQVDTTFGSNGIFVLPAAVFYTRLIRDPAGLLYVLGSANASGTASTQFVVTRLTADGTADNTFGTGGTATVTLPMGVLPFVANTIAVLNDGEVMVTLTTTDATKKGYLAALTSGGVVDTAFGPSTNGFKALPDKTFAFKVAPAGVPGRPRFHRLHPHHARDRRGRLQLYLRGQRAARRRPSPSPPAPCRRACRSTPRPGCCRDPDDRGRLHLHSAGGQRHAARRGHR